MSAKELLFSQYSQDNSEKQNDIYAINHLIQGYPTDEDIKEQEAVEVQSLKDVQASVYTPSQQKSQNIVIEPKKDGSHHPGLAQFQTLIEDKDDKAGSTKEPKEDDKPLDSKDSKGPDFIERFYYASLTVVGLYVLFRMIQKTK